MQYHLDLDRRRGRLYLRASGLWNVPLARRFLHDMRDVRSWVLYHRQVISTLIDLSGLPPHTQEVAPIVGDAATQLDDVAFGRSAMIVTGAVMKIQVQRIAPQQERHFFDNPQDAAKWLEWDDFVPIGDDEALIAEDGSDLAADGCAKLFSFAGR